MNREFLLNSAEQQCQQQQQNGKTTAENDMAGAQQCTNSIEEKMHDVSLVEKQIPVVVKRIEQNGNIAGGEHMMMNTTTKTNTWIRLNVGGKLFLTTRQTLCCRESGSFLARLSQEDHSLPSEKDEFGSYLIDRDSDYFSAVLNYLRHGKLILDHGLSEEGLREEAEFYNLPKLIAMCNERIAEREKQKKAGTKHVYRVLQCHEDELTNVISAMSDGWEFEQLIPIGNSSHVSESGHPEYLCVVSREYPVTANAKQNPEISSDRAQFLQKKAMNG